MSDLSGWVEQRHLHYEIPARFRRYDISEEALEALRQIMTGKPSPPTGDQKEDETST